MSDIKYQNDNFNFVYRVSAIIYNLDKSKILLFYGNDSDFYMLPGGKVKQLEDSKDAIKREIYEELGFTGIEFKYIGTSEEIVKNNNQFIQELTITYEGVYNKEVDLEDFKSKESDWINFKWVNISELPNYQIHPTNIIEFITNQSNHIIEKHI